MPPTDLEIALFLIEHITHPCTDYRTDKNLRESNIELAKRTMRGFENQDAKALLQNIINDFENQYS